MKFLCIGMMVCDYIITQIPMEIMSINGAVIRDLKITGGGDALNVAVALSQLGEQVAIVGRIADDLPGKYLLEYCEGNNVGVNGVVTDKNFKTATTFAIVDPTGERHFLIENKIYETYTDKIAPLSAIAGNDIIYIGSALTFPQMDQGGIAKIFSHAKSLGKITAMDAAIHGQTYNKNLLRSLRPALETTDIFLPSLAEMIVLTNQRNPYKIADCFKEFGIKTLVIKLGKDGCYVTDFNMEKIIQAVPVPHVIDTTGAGDTFVAGFLCGWAHGYNPFDCAKIGNIAASYSIQQIGSGIGLPTFTDLAKSLISESY